MRQGEDPEQLLKRQLRPKFVGLQDFLDRPLSLSMDRSPLARRALGLLKAIAVIARAAQSLAPVRSEHARHARCAAASKMPRRSL